MRAGIKARHSHWASLLYSLASPTPHACKSCGQGTTICMFGLTTVPCYARGLRVVRSSLTPNWSKRCRFLHQFGVQRGLGMLCTQIETAGCIYMHGIFKSLHGPDECVRVLSCQGTRVSYSLIRPALGSGIYLHALLAQCP